MNLTDKEWNPIAQCIRKWEGDNRIPFGDIRDAINAVYAKRNVAQPVDDNVLEAVALALYGSSENNWKVTGESTRARYRDEARRGIHVLLDAMRGPVTDKEVQDVGIPGWKASIEKLIDRRIDRILRPKKQTRVEMVVEVMAQYDVIGNTEMMAAEIVEKLEAHHDK